MKRRTRQVLQVVGAFALMSGFLIYGLAANALWVLPFGTAQGVIGGVLAYRLQRERDQERLPPGGSS